VTLCWAVCGVGFTTGFTSADGGSVNPAAGAPLARTGLAWDGTAGGGGAAALPYGAGGAGETGGRAAAEGALDGGAGGVSEMGPCGCVCASTGPEARAATNGKKRQRRGPMRHLHPAAIAIIRPPTRHRSQSSEVALAQSAPARHDDARACIKVPTGVCGLSAMRLQID